MKNLTLAGCAGMMLMFFSAPAWSDPVVGPWSYTPPTDTILAYESLPTASDLEEQTWVAGILGISLEDLLLQYDYTKDESDAVKFNQLSGYDPGFDWDYALVKVDGPNDFSYLFRDDNGVLPLSLANGDNLLTTPTVNTLPFNMIKETKPNGPHAISHVSFFVGGGEGVTPPIPEPSTLFLLGSGVLGLGILGRKRLSK